MNIQYIKKGSGILIIVLTLITSTEVIPLEIIEPVVISEEQMTSIPENLSFWERIGNFFSSRKEQRLENIKSLVSDISS